MANPETKRSFGFDRTICFDTQAVKPDRTRNQPLEYGEDDIHRQIKGEQGCEKLRPGESNREMVRIPHIKARSAALSELKGAKANPRQVLSGLALGLGSRIDVNHSGPA